MPNKACAAKVDELNLGAGALVHEEDVLRLQIAVDDLLLREVAQSLQDLICQGPNEGQVEAGWVVPFGELMKVEAAFAVLRRGGGMISSNHIHKDCCVCVWRKLDCDHVVVMYCSLWLLNLHIFK